MAGYIILIRSNSGPIGVVQNTGPRPAFGLDPLGSSDVTSDYDGDWAPARQDAFSARSFHHATQSKPSVAMLQRVLIPLSAI